MNHESWMVILKTVKRNRSRAFTVIELLVVIAVITVLGAMLFAGVSRARNMARRVRCMNNLNQIGKALMQYAGLSMGYLPILVDSNSVPWYEQVERGTGIDESFRALLTCPSQPHSICPDGTDTISADRVHYGYHGDVKREDGTAYKILSDGSLEGGAVTAADRDPDYFTMSEIMPPPDFILVGESDAREVAGNLSMNFSIAPAFSRTDRQVGMWHTEMGHVLTASGAVLLYGPEINTAGPEIDVLWTLPSD